MLQTGSIEHRDRFAMVRSRRRTEFPAKKAGNRRPCRDAGVGAIALGLAMLERAERASHIDPLTSSYAIMQRARPYCGENPEPDKDVTESLNPGPELENDQDPKRTFTSPKIQVHCTKTATAPRQAA
jgi:hypothetical protein